MVATQEQNRITPGIGAALFAFALFLLLVLWAQMFWRRQEGLDRQVATRVEQGARLEAAAVLSERLAVSRSAAFEKAEAAALVGRLTLDLTEAQLAPAGGRVDAFVFGGKLEVRVPEDWTVVRGDQVLLGAYVNRARREAADPEKVLRLDGLVIGGAIVVTH